MPSVTFVIKAIAAVAISGYVPPMTGGGTGGIPIVFEPFYMNVVESIGPGRSANSRIIGQFSPGDIRDVNRDNFNIVVILKPGEYTIGKDLTQEGARPGDIYITSVSGNRPSSISDILVLKP
ncbi:hypothetical protein ACQVP2_34920 [Methylobacterium aquaticum]|uniref:hypothetical protein n=1 Tax=Methylobacterium aquaticum TaxID=270351 RepID=UPI003D16513E